MSGSAPIIVTALFGKADAAWFDGLRRAHFPPERNQLEAHLTMFHHLAPSLEMELKHRLAGETRGVKPPQAWAASLISLGGGVAFRIESPELADIRDRLAEAFAPMLMPQDRAGWRPHVTIQNKVSAQHARVLLDRLNTNFRPRPLGIAGLSIHRYCDGPWDRLGHYRFRG